MVKLRSLRIEGQTSVTAVEQIRPKSHALLLRLLTSLWVSTILVVVCHGSQSTKKAALRGEFMALSFSVEGLG